MNRKSFELKFCFLFVSIAFAFFLGLPLANLAYKSLQTGSGTGLGNYAAILTDDAFLTAFRNSFAISALEAAITTAAAFILAYGLHLTRIPGKIKEGLQLVVIPCRRRFWCCITRSFISTRTLLRYRKLWATARCVLCG